MTRVIKKINQYTSVPDLSPYGLTPREMEIIDHICQGMSNTEIAQLLTISIETVKRHLSNIFDKTGQSTRTELALFSISKGLTVVNLTHARAATIQTIEALFDQIKRDVSKAKSLVRYAIVQSQAEAIKKESL